MFTVIVSNNYLRISGKMGFTIEHKALIIINYVIFNRFFRVRQPIIIIGTTQTMTNVSIKQKMR
jgi:hypothetical protein